MEESEVFETIKERFARHASALNPDILKYFNNSPMTQQDMSELVYGLDQLDDIVESSHFKNARVLETPDSYRVKPEVNRLFNSCKLHKNDYSWKIKSIGNGTQQEIAEFFARDYINVFFRLMYITKQNQINLTKDGNPYIIRLEPRTPHHLFAMFEFVDVNQKKVLRLPFFLNRLSKGLRIANKPQLAEAI